MCHYFFESFNPFFPTVPTFAVRETDVSRHNGGPSGAPLKPFRDDSALRPWCRYVGCSRSSISRRRARGLEVLLGGDQQRRGWGWEAAGGGAVGDGAGIIP